MADAVTIDPDWEATFVVADPPRASWFALWNPASPGGVLATDLKPADVELVLPASPAVATSPDATFARTTVAAARLTMRDATEVFAQLRAGAPMQESVRVWASVVRTGLDLVARGRAIPWVSPDGWDTWRVDPLDGDDLLRAEALAGALPAYGHCRPLADGGASLLITDAEHAVRQCYDAVADRLVRAPASGIMGSSPVFADLQPQRVRHLRPWVADVAGPLCRGARLAVQAIPPRDVGPDDDSFWMLQLELRSARDPSLVVPAEQLWRSPSIVRGQFGPNAEVDLLVGLQEAAAICPLFQRALDTHEPTLLDVDDDEFEFFLDALDRLSAAGIDIRWPAEVVNADVQRRMVVGAGAPGDALPTVNDIRSLLKVNWEFLLDGTPLTVAELQALAAAKSPVIPLRGRWVRLSSQSRHRLLGPPPDVDPGDALAAALAGEAPVVGNLFDQGGEEYIEVRAVGAVGMLVARLREITKGRAQEEPAGLQATLRHYQRQGLAWLSDLSELGVGACLADDMGLGKTVQVLALHQSKPGRTLVVCPTSLLANWEREAAKFVPDTKVIRHHGPRRSLADVGPNDLVVTTYGVVRSDSEALAEIDWDIFVADEAQHAKNPRSRTAKAIRSVPAGFRLALTGTPVENRLTELWSIMDWAVPGLLGPLDRFRREVAVPIERDQHEEVANRLATTIGPFLLRRTKLDPGIAPELPAKTERDVIVPLTTEQISLYRATTNAAMADLAENEGLVRHGLILKLLTALKQITNHPAQYLGEREPLAGRSGKLDALEEILDRAHRLSESTLVFTQYVAMGELLSDHLNGRGIENGLLHGALSVSARQQLVDRFQAGELPVLLLSLKAGGTGLNLTKATQVVHFDRWWNPAVEDQATDRAYRIGQDRPVTVHRLITEGTVEDRVAELLAAKRDLADRVVGAGASWIGELDDDALAALVELDETLGEEA